MKNTACNAVVMAGGFGTRLKPLTVTLPKPMVPIGNRPLMEHVVDLLAEHKLTSAMFLLYYQPEAIMDHFGDGDSLGLSIQYLRPDADFGTAGSVRFALPQLADRFVVISGDVLTDIDLSAALAFHESVRAEATIVLTRKENPLAFGIVVTDPDGRITRFLEKPSWGEVFTDTINTGIYILERSLMETLPTDQFLDFGKDVFPQFLKEGRRLYGCISPGYWRDIGNVNEYSAAHSDLLDGRFQTRWQFEPRSWGEAKLIADPTGMIAGDAVLEGTVVLGERVSIGPGARISDSVIGPGSVVGSGAQIRRSVLWSAVSVGGQSSLDETIVQTGARLGRKTTLMERTIVSELCQIGSGVTVRANCRIWPRKRVEDGATVASSLVWGEQYSRELFTDAKVSGLTNREITPEFAARLGAAFASQFGTAESIVLARDHSVEARAVAEAMKSGIASSGVNTRDLRDTVVPVVRHELTEGGGCAGVYVRCNPADPLSTDAIFFDADGFDLPAGRAQSVERLFLSEDFRRANPAAMGVIEYPEGTLERYRSSFLRQVDVEAIRKFGFRIVVDYCGGLAGAILPSILTAQGVETISLNSHPRRPDGYRTEDDYRALSRIVTAVGYDFGVSISPFAEKMVIADRHGSVLAAQQLLVVMASLFWQWRPKATIATPVMATAAVDRLARQIGANVVRLKNDHLSMMRAAASDSIDFVCGTRGGFILPPWQRGADAMMSVILLLEWLASADTELTEVAAQAPVGTMAEGSVPCPWARKGALMRRLMDETSEMERELVDGVRLLIGEDWVWVAPDRRTAHFTLLAESAQPWRAESLLAEWQDKIAKWRDDLDTPTQAAEPTASAT